jgi:ribosomal-protein-alanine N-acetyltransferase
VRNREFFRPFDPERPAVFFTEEGQSEAIAAAEVDRTMDRAYVFGIIQQETDRLTGRIALSNVVRGAWDNANLGYWVANEFNGRGYATAAVGLILRSAFGPDLGFHRIQAGVMPRNVASTRVLEKNGFRLEGLALRYLLINGRWEDHNIYAVTREELPA